MGLVVGVGVVVGTEVGVWGWCGCRWDAGGGRGMRVCWAACFVLLLSLHVLQYVWVSLEVAIALFIPVLGPDTLGSDTFAGIGSKITINTRSTGATRRTYKKYLLPYNYTILYQVPRTFLYMTCIQHATPVKNFLTSG